MADTTPLFLALLFGSAGIGYLVYGRRPGRQAWFFTGLALLFLPFVVTTAVPMAVVGVLLLMLPHVLKRW